MLVSFIIPHKGREELLERTLQSVFELDFDQNEREIIVVTQNIALACASIDRSRFAFTTIFRPERETISTLRNVGVTHASGEYLAFLDADIQLSPNWLRVMFSEFEANPERVLVSARQQGAPDAGIIEVIRVLLQNTANDRAVQFLDGRNLFLKREIFEKAGGFPEDLVTCEDYYFTHNVHQLGEMYVSSKTAYVHLGEDKSFNEMFRKEIWRGQANLQSLGKRALTIREVPSLLTPLWQAFFFFAVLISLLSGHVTWGLFFLGLVCLPILLYAVRLYRIGKNRVRFTDAFQFYSVYLAARSIGTIIGRVKTIRM